jgi:hypothetical protein
MVAAFPRIYIIYYRISTGSSNWVTAQLLGMATLGCTTTNPSK